MSISNLCNNFKVYIFNSNIAIINNFFKILEFLKENGIKTTVNKWSLIEKAFEKPIKSSYDLEKAILSYNIKYKNRWNFKALHLMFRKMVRKLIII